MTMLFIYKLSLVISLFLILLLIKMCSPDPDLKFTKGEIIVSLICTTMPILNSVFAGLFIYVVIRFILTKDK